jgi:hypothetical protein
MMRLYQGVTLIKRFDIEKQMQGLQKHPLDMVPIGQ